MSRSAWSLAGPYSLGLTSITWTDGRRKQLWLRDIQSSQIASRSHNTVVMTQPQDGGWERRKLEEKQWRGNPAVLARCTHQWAANFCLRPIPSMKQGSQSLPAVPWKRCRSSITRLPFLPVSFRFFRSPNQSNSFLSKTALTRFLWYLQAPKMESRKTSGSFLIPVDVLFGRRDA